MKRLARISDEVAATLPIPKKEELLGYLRDSYEAIECFIESSIQSIQTSKM